MSALHWTRSAIAHHFRSSAVISELVVTALAIYLLMVSAEPMTLARFMLYPGITALLLAGMLAYRRAALCRSDKSHVNLEELTDTRSFLIGEMLASLILTALLTLAVIGVGAACYPELVAEHPGQVAAGYAIILLAASSAVALQYLFSGLCLRTEMASVLAIVAIVLGASRSALADEVHQALDRGFGLGHYLSQVILAVARIIFPPLEELIKSAMYGVTATTALYLVQGGVYAAIVAWVALLLIRRGQEAAVPGEAGPAQKKPSPRASQAP